jgi:hypothetical protein
MSSELFELHGQFAVITGQSLMVDGGMVKIR